MPYIHRTAGQITGLSRWSNGSTEQLPDDHPDVVAFNNPPPSPPHFEGVAVAIANAPNWDAGKAILAQWIREQ